MPADPLLQAARSQRLAAPVDPEGLRCASNQQLQPREALAASTDGVGTLAVGGRADLVLLEEADELFADVPVGTDGLMDEAAAREAAARLRAVDPLATVVAGRLESQR